METIKISELQPHPRNQEFFDQMTGENWKEFLKSIETSGVIEPIVITQDKMIVSGHERVRACEKLGIEVIQCRIKIYEGTDKLNKDDLILKDLLETNLRQRGIGNLNAMKLARCVMELERLYGVRKGSAGKSDQNNFGGKSQKQLAKEFGLTDQQLRNYKKLLNLIPELQQEVEEENLPPSIAIAVYSKLTPEQQREVVEQLGMDQIAAMTRKESQKVIDELLNEKEILVLNKTMILLKSNKTYQEIHS